MHDDNVGPLVDDYVSLSEGRGFSVWNQRLVVREQEEREAQARAQAAMRQGQGPYFDEESEAARRKLQADAMEREIRRMIYLEEVERQQRAEKPPSAMDPGPAPAPGSPSPCPGCELRAGRMPSRSSILSATCDLCGNDPKRLEMVKKLRSQL